jgi:hypothetical protein
VATRAEIERDITVATRQVQDVQNQVRRKCLKELADYTQRPVILYATAFGLHKYGGAPGLPFSITIEDIQGFMAALHGVKGTGLDLILHSPGGSLEAAEQIVNYLRAKFPHVRAIIPQSAMSAATMVACACNEILMGKQSALGPIDPQITMMGPEGPATLPAQAILDEFALAKAEILSDPRLAAVWIPKLQKLPHGFLKHCQTTIELAKERVASWLSDYMLHDAAASKIAANWLGSNTEHKTHGRPISAALAKSIGLNVVAMEDDQQLQDKVLSVYHATMLTFEKTNCVKIIESHEGKGFYVGLHTVKP